MSVLIEAFTVIIRQSTLAEKYPNGLNGYHRDRPNARFCADNHLAAISFMVDEDAQVFIARLVTKGITPSQAGSAAEVALIDSSLGPTLPCDWLMLGQWGTTILAWLKGMERGDLHAPPHWNADNPIQRFSADEAKQRLKLVRTDGHVDVYQDQMTGQTLYAGRTTSAAQAARHNDLSKRATNLAMPLILLDGRTPERLGWLARRRLKKAISLLQETIDINSTNWSAKWLLGKIYQRLGDHVKSFEWFSKAYSTDSKQITVCREAALAAMHLGKNAEAIDYCRQALAMQPSDPGLLSNLALALLLSERPDEAGTIIAQSLRLDPNNAVTRKLSTFIGHVVAGTKQCPRHIRELK